MKSLFRKLLATCFAFTVLAVITAPAMAASVTRDCYTGPTGSSMGVCGYWEVYDASVGKKGAVCVYSHSSPYDLDRITVRPPLMHGYYAGYTKVGWRFLVLRRDANGGTWDTVYTSSWQKALANDAIPANVGHGFSRRAWTSPGDPLASYIWRIVIDLGWWHYGILEGYTELNYDWYKLVDNAVGMQAAYCPAVY